MPRRQTTDAARAFWGTKSTVRYARLLVADTPRYARIEGEAFILLDQDPLRGPAGPTGEEVAMDGARLLSPFAPSKILGVGLNYRAHAAEMNKPLPDEPLLFLKPPSALIATATRSSARAATRAATTKASCASSSGGAPTTSPSTTRSTTCSGIRS